MSTAEVALAVSICSAAVAVSGLIWNVVAFLKNGPRVDATMTMGTHGRASGDVGRVTLTIDAKTWAKHERFRTRPDQHFFISARNTGRSAIWVDQVGLASGETIASMNVIMSPGEPDLGFGPGLPYKLEAGQTVRWALPIGHATGVYQMPPLSDDQCVHGHVSLGDGTVRRTKAGARVGLIRQALTASQPNAAAD